MNAGSDLVYLYTVHIMGHNTKHCITQVIVIYEIRAATVTLIPTDDCHLVHKSRHCIAYPHS
jgi:hypothetical protein